MKYKYLYLVLSALVLIPGIVSLVWFGLKVSVDFSGGSVIKYEKTEPMTQEKLKDTFQELGIKVESFVTAEDSVTLKTGPIESFKIEVFKQKVAQDYYSPRLLSFETVGPTIGKETTKNAIIALVWASVGILLYIAYAFRNVPKPYSSFRFGVSAIVAMLHDAFVVIGLFSIFGRLWGMEVDALFITALLTIIGFSVHDTIVVFDRIRENLNKLPNHWTFEEVTNYSLVETLNRSLATSFTVILTLSALYLLGGETIKTFVLALLVGIISGTYSSIFNAAPILVIWENFVRSKNK